MWSVRVKESSNFFFAFFAGTFIYQTDMSNNASEEKILIANRGEAACRIIRTAKKMGLRTVAVYSESDINSLHVAMADESVLLGGATSADSYLNMDKIVNVCKKLGVKYVHPGWGFLSENYKFVELLDKEKIIFIGPSANSMKLIGDKISSKEISGKIGVSILKTSKGILKSVGEVKETALDIGYPVILKASAGGGGKGIRICYSENEIENAFESVRNEAKNSFGDDRIFMEKFIENPKHIEIQLLGDKFGNIVCLGERDCSIQRNNQKIIEEAPCVTIDERTRFKMYAQAIALAKEVGYFSVGTLEFLMDAEKNFYFMEMNTRLQVEHTVTEMITGLDLVEQMVKVARGEKLEFTQQDIKLDGFAMECRINAEDPSRGFLPSSGRISKYLEPEKDAGVRVDTGVYEGCFVSMFYDNMLSKLIVHGKDRNATIEKMQMALGSFFIDGVLTNIPFLEAITYNNTFRSGEFNTGFIKKEFLGSFSNTLLDKSESDILIASVMYMHVLSLERLRNISGQITTNKKSVRYDGLVCDVNGTKYFCKISKVNDAFVVNYDNNFISVKTNWYFGDDIFRAEINGKLVNVRVIENDKSGGFKIQYAGVLVNVSVRTPRISELEKFMPTRKSVKKPKNLKAPITGKIVKFFVENESEVKMGGQLLVIEAMKMENVIRTDFDVCVKNIKYKVGDLVGIGEVIMDFEY